MEKKRKFSPALFFLFLLLYCGFLVKNILPVNSTLSYQDLLKEAERLLQSEQYNETLVKLDGAKQLVSEPDAVYFFLLGQTLEKMGHMPEAIAAYQDSLKRNGQQPKLLFHMADLFQKEEKPIEELQILKLYITLQPSSPEIYYRAMILAARTGEESFIQKRMESLEADKTYLQRKEEALQAIHNLVLQKQFKKAINQCSTDLPRFPNIDALHSLCLIAHKLSNSNELEQSMIAAAGLAQNPVPFSLKYTHFLVENNRIYDALSSCRRTLLLSLLHKNTEIEIFSTLRQIYYRLGKSADSEAITALKHAIQEKKDITYFLKIISDFPMNREVRLYYLFQLKQTQVSPEEYKLQWENLRKRDDMWQWNEYIFGNYPFAKEKLMEKILSPPYNNFHP